MGLRYGWKTTQGKRYSTVEPFVILIFIGNSTQYLPFPSLHSLSSVRTLFYSIEGAIEELREKYARKAEIEAAEAAEKVRPKNGERMIRKLYQTYRNRLSLYG